MSKADPFYYVPNHAVDRFKERFGAERASRDGIRKLIVAIAHNGMKLALPGKHKRGQCIVGEDRRSGRRVFLVAMPDDVHQSMVIKAVLTQDQACRTYGYTFPKESVNV